MHKFEIGQKVQLVMIDIKSRFFVAEMQDALGDIGEVVDVRDRDPVLIRLGIHYWNVESSWIVPEDEELKVGDKVRVRMDIPDGVVMRGLIFKKRELFRDQEELEIIRLEDTFGNNKIVREGNFLFFVPKCIRTQDKNGRIRTFYRAFLEKVEEEFDMENWQPKVGDEVIVPRIPKDRFEPPIFIAAMENFVGEVCIIREILMEDEYLLEMKGVIGPLYYVFKKSWFQPVGKIVKKKPIVKKVKPITKRDIQQKISEARKILKEKGVRGICNYIVIEEKYKKLILREQISDVCHARMGTITWGDRGKAITMVDWIAYHNNYLKPELQTMYKDYVKYVLERSVAKDCWLTSRAQDAFKHGLVIDNTKPVSQVVFGTIMMRMGSEYAAHRLPVFNAVRKAGFSDETAFILFSMVACAGEKFVLHGLQGHSCVNSSMSLEDIVSFFTGVTTFQGGVPYHEYSADWRVFDQIGSVQAPTSIIEQLKKWTKAKNKGFGQQSSFSLEVLLEAAANIEQMIKQVKK